MPRLACLLLVVVSACFSVPDFVDGELRCDQGRCPPGLSCAGDGFCRRAAPAADAPLALDAARDAAIADAVTADRPPPDATFDARPCTEGDRRCGGGDLEVCVGGVYITSVPSCPSMGQTCFDPQPAGGTDAYCGTCLKGARRCTNQPATPTVQICPASSGLWTSETACNPSFGCVDTDGDDGPAAYCGECVTGERRCTASVRQTCVDARWTDEDCAATAGFTCFDPAPAGGNDAYCGACVKNETVCRGDNLDRCNADGSGYVTVEMCAFGCLASSPSCCAMPTCSGSQICGQSPPNACGRRVSCGSCSGSCCLGGELCCSAGRECCDTICCGSSATCCEPGICSSGACP